MLLSSVGCVPQRAGLRLQYRRLCQWFPGSVAALRGALVVLFEQGGS